MICIACILSLTSGFISNLLGLKLAYFKLLLTIILCLFELVVMIDYEAFCSHVFMASKLKNGRSGLLLLMVVLLSFHSVFILVGDMSMLFSFWS